jgi:hypothetical protein
MKRHTKPRGPALVVGTALAAALLLVACGGDDHNTAYDPGTGGPGQSNPVDAFFAAVQGQVSVTAETTGEPIAIDSLVATTNEDQEPVAI